MLKHLFFAIVLLFSSPCFAGAKGFTAVLINIGEAAFFDTKTYTAYRDGELIPIRQLEDCWHHRATGIDGVEHIIRKKLPDGMTKEIASAIWAGDKAAMKKAQQVMKAAQRSYGSEIDGMYILKSEKDTVSMMALGTRGSINAKNPSKKLTISWSDANPGKSAADFDLALCKVSKPLSFQFNP